VEWSCTDVVRGLRVSLNDGHQSPVLGQVPDDIFMFDRTIEAVQVGVTSDSFIASLIFIDD
jgi:hypothetical protein